MEMQILLFGIALPSFFGAAFGIWFMRRKQAGRLDCFVGLALATTLFLSAISEDSLIQFMALNRWLWFPISMLLGAVVVGAGLLFAQSPLARTLVVLASTISAAILLNIPSWEIFTNRLFLGVGAATSAIFLAQVVKIRANISTYIGLSLSLIGPSVLAMLSGFAKLAIPIGAVSFCLGIISLVHIAIQSKSLDRAVGLSGAVVIASIAAFGAATGFGYDTTNLPISSWVIAAIAPLGLWMGELPMIRSRTILSAWARICGCTILAATAILIAALLLSSNSHSLSE